MTQALLYEKDDGSTEIFVDTLHPSHVRERYEYFARMVQPPRNMRIVEIDFRERRDTIPSQPHPDCMSARLDGE